MAELLITSSISPIEEGQVFPGELPLHVTIGQDFYLPDSHLELFERDLEVALGAFSPIEIVGTDNDLFGPNSDKPVRRVTAVGRQATLTAFHTVAMQVVDRYEGVLKNPEWAYEGFQPHITYVNGKALRRGEQALLRQVEVIQRFDANRKIKNVRKIQELEEAS